jgi:uncharacterized SAM-binding protein YcdF (DUF218 family)
MGFDAFQCVTILNRLSEPFTVALLLLAAGCLLLWSERRPAAGKVLILCATTGLLLIAYGVPFSLVARSLESKYAPIAQADLPPDVRWIVVLGGGHASSPALPAITRSSTATLYRVSEAVRLHRMIPGSHILFSGGTTFDEVPDARVSSAAALELGVAAADISLSPRPRTTAEEMACVRAVVGSQPFIMVTTAMHMPRAMLLAQSYGLRPIPSPTDFRARPAGEAYLFAPFPKAGAPLLASATFHEVLGLVWLRLRMALGRSLVTPVACTEAYQ